MPHTVRRTRTGAQGPEGPVELRPEVWQRLAAAYGPAGRQVSAYSASISQTRRNQSVRTLHDVADRLEQLLAGE